VGRGMAEWLKELREPPYGARAGLGQASLGLGRGAK